MYKAGKKTKQIATEIGITQALVIRYVKLQDNEAFKDKIRTFTSGEMQKMYNLYRKGTSLVQIRRKYGISYQKLQAYIVKRDPEVSFKDQHKENTANKREVRKQAVMVLRKTGNFSSGMICELLGINRGTYAKYTKK